MEQDQKADALRQAQQARNDYVANATDDKPIDMEQLNKLVKAEYDAAAYAAGREPTQPKPLAERDPHKSTFDLEDITGDPGHRGVTPYAPAGAVSPSGFSGSLNEAPAQDEESQPQPSWPLA